MEVVGRAINDKQALRMAFNLQPDVITAIVWTWSPSGPYPVVDSLVALTNDPDRPRIYSDKQYLRSSAEMAEYDIPLAEHPLVDMYVKHFSGRGRWYFAKWLSRADRYLPIMQPILEKKGVPRDLVYVAMVESGFSARAVSVAAASRARPSESPLRS